ncbi:MAG: glycosyltransferase family 2 protein [Terracidiphilus sp.]
MPNPLVSIVILNYKRLSALEQTLESVVAQTYAHREIIVVDNHSEEEVATAVQRFGPEIQLIELDRNLGACGGRNVGLNAARGEIVITLDNDISFLSSGAINTVVRIFDEHADFHVLAFQLRDPVTGELRLREWCHPKDWREFSDVQFPTHFFVEGAAAYRRAIFESAGVYFEPLFVYNEGWDLGLRILDQGFRILYTPEIKVRHLMSAEARSSSRSYFLFTRNYVWIAYKDYPFWAGLRFVIFRMAMMAYFACRAREWGNFFTGLWEGIWGCRNIKRSPIRKTTVKYVKELERGRPNLLLRYLRHSIVPQL